MMPKQVYQHKNIKTKLYKNNATIWYNKTCTTGFVVSTYGLEDGGRKDFRNVLVLVNLTMYQAQISIFNKLMKLSSINFELDYSELIRMTGTEVTAFTGSLDVTFTGTLGVTFTGTLGVTFTGTLGVTFTGMLGVTFSSFLTQ
jgi:hypothetical protein